MKIVLNITLAIFLIGFIRLADFKEARSESEIYSSTDDTGINKKERIDSVELFLATFSKKSKTIEEENNKKINELHKNLNMLIKENKEDKIKIESMRVMITQMQESIKKLQGDLKNQLEVSNPSNH